MLIDVHAHFWHERGPRADWDALNRRRLSAGDRIGISVHVASVLGSWGFTSPTYFMSPDDVTFGNDWLLEYQRQHPDRVRGYVAVNPNFGPHALGEIARCADQGMIGVKLAASRRADDSLLDPICQAARARALPILHHVWQHRRRDWPGQEASDAVELCTLARRHPEARFILAHIGGGGDWLHSLPIVAVTPNVWIDLSGSGVDGGMLEACIHAVGPARLLWGCDLTIDTGWAKLRRLERLLDASALEQVRWRNAAELFPPGAFAGAA
ncbi:MAG: amidohydrolase [Gemmatimonadota bacterium]|nr:amidohydrolase [Gemmatimonadota bacterium]